MKKPIQYLVVVCLAVLAINYLANTFYHRFDLTNDQRFTLSAEATNVAKAAKSKVIIDVFLEGELPGEFRKLRNETSQILEEFKQINPNISVNFINPTEDLDSAALEQVTQQLSQFGIKPAMANIMQAGKSTRVVLFPWALMVHEDKKVAVPLLKTVARASTEERVNSSIAQLEYQFADALRKVTQEKTKKIAVLRDSKGLADIQIHDFVKSLQEYYRVAPFAIEFVTKSDSVQPQQVLESLHKFDLVIDPKPTLAYSETKKYVLDQYVMKGGKLLLAIDPIIFETDSLANPNQVGYGMKRDLNIDDLLFKYGLRLDFGILKDEQCGPLALATGNGRNTQYEAFNWPYFPASKSVNNHPITKNLEEVKFEYTGTIDTLRNGINHTVLLKSSEKSTIKVLPARISLNELDQPIDPLAKPAGRRPLAVLSEGIFTSAYRNRVTPFNTKEHKDKSVPTSIVLIADGDIMKNQTERGIPQELGYDIRTGALFGNKEFLMNTVNYLLDDNGLIELRNKNIVIPFLNPESTYNNKGFWQLINTIIPIAFILLIAIMWRLIRSRKYSK